MYYVYTLTDINGNVYYVGITNDVQRRYEQHKKDESNADKFLWLKTNANFINVIDTADSKAEAEIKEEQYIKHYKKYQKLFNKQKVYTKAERISEAIKACEARIKELRKGNG